MSISVIIPVKNESENVGILAKEIYVLGLANAQMNIVEILFIDDNSEDDTLKQITLSSIQFPAVKGISLRGAKGKGAAIKVGVKEAIGDIIVTMDGDLQHPPNQIESLVKPILEDRSDIIVASRDNGDYSTYRGFLSKIFSWIFNMLFTLSLTTPNDGFKAFRRSDATSLEINANGFDFDIEFLVRSKRVGLRIKETPIALRKRMHGKSKVQTVKVAFSFLHRMMKLWLE